MGPLGRVFVLCALVVGLLIIPGLLLLLLDGLGPLVFGCFDVDSFVGWLVLGCFLLLKTHVFMAVEKFP